MGIARVANAFDTWQATALTATKKEQNEGLLDAKWNWSWSWNRSFICCVTRNGKLLWFTKNRNQINLRKRKILSWRLPRHRHGFVETGLCRRTCLQMNLIDQSKRVKIKKTRSKHCESKQTNAIQQPDNRAEHTSNQWQQQQHRGRH